MVVYLQISDLLKQSKTLRQNITTPGAIALQGNIANFLSEHPAAHPNVIAYLKDAQQKLATPTPDNVDRVTNNLRSAAQVSDSGTFITLEGDDVS